MENTRAKREKRKFSVLTLRNAEMKSFQNYARQYPQDSPGNIHERKFRQKNQKRSGVQNQKRKDRKQKITPLQEKSQND